MRLPRITSTVASLVAVVALSACGPAAELSTPASFAELEDQDAFEYRATSAQGVVIAVRAEDNEPRGNLDFWAGVLDAKLRGQGYEPTSEPESSRVEAQGGLTGRVLSYSRTESRRAHRYVVAVFVTEDSVYLVEAGGDEAHFDAQTDVLIRKAITSLEVG